MMKTLLCIAVALLVVTCGLGRPQVERRQALETSFNGSCASSYDYNSNSSYGYYDGYYDGNSYSYDSNSYYYYDYNNTDGANDYYMSNYYYTEDDSSSYMYVYDSYNDSGDY